MVSKFVIKLNLNVFMYISSNPYYYYYYIIIIISNSILILIIYKMRDTYMVLFVIKVKANHIKITEVMNRERENN